MLDPISPYIRPVNPYDSNSIWDQSWDPATQNQNSRKIQLPHMHDTMQSVKAKSQEVGYVDLDATLVNSKRPKLRENLQLSHSLNDTRHDSKNVKPSDSDKTGSTGEIKGEDRKILLQIFAALTTQREQRKTGLTMVLDKLQKDMENHKLLRKEQQNVTDQVTNQSVTDRILGWVSWVLRGAFVLSCIIGAAALGAANGLAAAGAIAGYGQTAVVIMQTLVTAAQGFFKTKMDTFNQEMEKLRHQIDKAQKKIKTDQSLMTNIYQEQTKTDKMQKDVLDAYNQAMRGMIV